MCLKKHTETIKGEMCIIETFGQNIHTILKNEFFMNSTMGEFAKRIIQEISQKLQSKSIMEINELLTIENKIGMIGEPIIKNHLMKLLEDHRSIILSKNKKQQIEYHREKLKELEES